MSTFYHIEPLNQSSPYQTINERERHPGERQQKKKKKPKQPPPPPQEEDDSSEHNIDEYA